MVPTFIDFALVVLKLLILKVCVISGVSEIMLLIFSGSEKVKQNEKTSETVQSLLNL